MSVQVVDDPFPGHSGPWTEEDWLALPESNHRVELLDGSLVVSPLAVVSHQRVTRNTARALERAAPRGFEVFEGLNVRTVPGTILIPDVVVLSIEGLDGKVVDPEHVALVAEVTSPSNSWFDRRVKRELYADAGIATYLRIDLHRGVDPISATAYGLGADGYDEVGSATGRLVLRAPFPVELDVPELARATR